MSILLMIPHDRTKLPQRFEAGRGEGNPWNHMAPMRVSFPVCNIPNDEHTRGSSVALHTYCMKTQLFQARSSQDYPGLEVSIMNHKIVGGSHRFLNKGSEINKRYQLDRKQPVFFRKDY